MTTRTDSQTNQIHANTIRANSTATRTQPFASPPTQKGWRERCKGGQPPTGHPLLSPLIPFLLPHKTLLTYRSARLLERLKLIPWDLPRLVPQLVRPRQPPLQSVREEAWLSWPDWLGYGAG